MAKAKTNNPEVKSKDAPKAVGGTLKPKRLNAMDLQLKEAVQASYTALVPAGTTREDVLEPGYWSHCASQLQAMTEITIIPKDGEWYGRYFVRFADRTSARLAELEWMKLTVITVDEMENADYDVDFTTGEKFRVIRASDGMILEKNFNTREAAFEWMANHMKSVAA